MRFARLTMASAALLASAGCHSAYVEATLRNGTAQPITLVELDYPSASFGTQSLAPGAEFKYRFKVQGSGPLKLVYTDTARKEHDVPGPQLAEGDEGSLNVVIQPEGIRWVPRLKGHKDEDFPIAPN